MNLIQQLEKEQFDKLAATKVLPEFCPGHPVTANLPVVEGQRPPVEAYARLSKLQPSNDRSPVELARLHKSQAEARLKDLLP
mgnify:CR=1 FL=1